MKKVIIVLVALLVYLVLAWLVGGWIGLQGSDLWILRGGLSLIGIVAAAVLIWFFRKREQAGPAESSVLKEIDAAVRSAAARLRTARNVQGRRLADLPVVLLLGDSGSCKTSVIAQSGLDAELLAGQVFEDNAVVATPCVNLWYARNMAFVETGGRLQTDNSAWEAVVRKFQPSRLRSLFRSAEAPRAALVCISCDDLLQSGGDGQVALARSLRARLDAVSATLGVQLPVYVLLTKADRLIFFPEFVRHLTNDEAGQVLGVTLPMQVDGQSGIYAERASRQLNTVFDNLVFALCDRRPDLLAREHDPEKLSGIYEFPREVRKLRSPLVSFLVELCKPTQLGAAPFLRGFYFTGVRATFVTEAVRQAPSAAEVKPRVEADATRFFKLGESSSGAAAAAPQMSRKVPQWVFLSHFFSDVLLQDRMALGASSGSVKSGMLKRVALAAVTAIALLLCVALLVSFTSNRGLANELAEASKTAAANADSIENGLPSAAALNSLEQFRAVLQRVADYHRNGPPLRMRWGLYSGDRLFAPARKLYFEHFAKLLFTASQATVVADLKRLPETPAANDEYGPAYDGLKAYLITTANHDKSTVAFLSPVLIKYWSTNRNVDAARLATAQKQFDFYAAELKDSNPYSSESDADAVRRARKYLSGFAGTEQVYQFMLAEASGKVAPVNFNRQFPGAAPFVTDGKEVPGAYTKAGWAFMNDAIKNADRFFSGEEWVLGARGGVQLDRAQIEQKLRQRYLGDFVNQWREFLRSASVVRYSSVKEASQKLTTLSGNQSPLLALFWTVSQNTGVDSPELQAAFQPVHTVLPPASVDRYIGEKNSPYVNALVALQAQLEQLSNAPGGSSDVLAAQAASTALQAKVVTRQLAQNFKIDPDGHVEAMVQKLMEDPITNVESLVRNVGPAELNGKGKAFCSQLRDLAVKYPFTASATAQATMAEFNGIFQPVQGAMWTFYDLSLKTQLVRQGSVFVQAPTATMAVNPAFLTFWNRLAAVSDAVYPNNSAQPHLAFSLKLQQQVDAIENLTLSIGDQELKGAENAFKPFAWPSGSRSEVKLTGSLGRGPDLAFFTYDGPWSIFQFFGDADRWTTNGSISTLEFVLRQGRAGRPLTLADGSPLTLRFEVDMGKMPPFFQKNYLPSLGCVSDVAKP